MTTEDYQQASAYDRAFYDTYERDRDHTSGFYARLDGVSCVDVTARPAGYVAGWLNADRAIMSMAIPERDRVRFTCVFCPEAL